MYFIPQFPLNCQQQVSWPVHPSSNAFFESGPHTNEYRASVIMLGFIQLALCIMLSELGGNWIKIIIFSCKANK